MSSALSNILTAKGLKVGFFSSPHLVDFTERFRINGEPVSKQVIYEVGGEMLDKYGGIGDPLIGRDDVQIIGDGDKENKIAFVKEDHAPSAAASESTAATEVSHFFVIEVPPIFICKFPPVVFSTIEGKRCWGVERVEGVEACTGEFVHANYALRFMLDHAQRLDMKSLPQYVKNYLTGTSVDILRDCNDDGREDFPKGASRCRNVRKFFSLRQLYFIRVTVTS